MKKFIKYFFFFISPLVLLSYFLDFFISNNLKKSNKYAEKEYPTWNAIIDGKVNSDILIYGNSRAWVDFNPTMISDSLHISAYNLGIDGHGFKLQYLRHRMLLKNNNKPKIIIVSVDIFILNNRKELYNSEQFLPYMLWNREIKSATIDYDGFNSLDYDLPLIRYYGKTEALETAIRFFSGHLSNPVCRVKGYQGRNESWNTDFDKAKLNMKKYEAKLDSETIILFEKFLAECKKQNIKLIFVNAPEYIEGQKFTKNRGEVLSLYTNYSHKYNIPFYDYSNDAISYQKKYFYNTVHMNKTGAELFTAKLIDTLKHSSIIKELKN
jgi:hypothetical protein